jgi:hypothetical protein
VAWLRHATKKRFFVEKTKQCRYSIATQELARTKQNQKDEWRRFAPPLIFLVLCPKQNLYQFPKVWLHFWELKTKPSKGFKITKWLSHFVIWYYIAI